MTQEDGAADHRVLNLAAEVAEAADKKIPDLLLQLQDILESSRGEKARQVRLDIWGYDLLQVLVLSFRQDFNKQHGQWSTAASLVSILSKCCFGLDPPESQQFYGVFLPDAVERILTLCRKLQVRYTKTSHMLADVKEQLLESFRSILDSLSFLFGAHNFLTANVLKSSWMLQMLMSDDVKTCVIVMGTIQSANRMKIGVMGTLDEKVVNGLLDELIYKLSASTDETIASTTTRAIINICDYNPQLVEYICTRYRGLRPLINKWHGKGFGRDLRKLILLLESGTAQKAETEKKVRAAARIQAAWKSYYTRQTLKKANTAFTKFQKSFRVKQDHKQKVKDEERQQKELHHVLMVRRRKAMRELYNRRLEALNVLPAGEIDKHVDREESQAATKIQARYRGYLTRRRLSDVQASVKEVRAAVKIQRKIRSWLERIRAKKREPPGWQRPPGLTDERRVELLEHIMQWREEHPVKAQTDEERTQLHENVQEMVKRHVISSKMHRSAQQRRQALLARLELDSRLLIDAPKLDEINDTDLGAYVCRSVPIATKARQNHNEELRLLRQPWWRKLGDEYQDQKLEEENVDWKVF